MSSKHTDRKVLSKDAYRALNLAESQREVLQVLLVHGPLTANGIAAHLPHSLLRNVRSRLNELEAKGVVAGIEKVRDPLSKKRVILWAVREGDETVPLAVTTTKRSRLQSELARVACANVELNFQVAELQDALRLNRQRLRIFFNKHPAMLKHWQIVVSAKRDGRERSNDLEGELPSLP